MLPALPRVAFPTRLSLRNGPHYRSFTKQANKVERQLVAHSGLTNDVGRLDALGYHRGLRYAGQDVRDCSLACPTGHGVTQYGRDASEAAPASPRKQSR